VSAPDPQAGAAGEKNQAGQQQAVTEAESSSASAPSQELPERRWTWMDRWDPGTWEMPSNPTRLQRVLAGLALVFIFIMTVYVPFRMLGVF
jgi:hypothetical protein